MTDEVIAPVAAAEPAVATPETPVVATETTKTEAPSKDIESLLGDDKAEGAEPKEGEGENKTAEAPSDYEFKLADDMVEDPEIMGEFKGIAKDLGIPQEKAQKLVDMAGKIAQKAQDDAHSAWRDTNTAWIKEMRSDKEMGGSKLDENLASINEVFQNKLDAKGFKAFKEALKFTGAGNNPDIIRALFRVTQKVSEGGGVSGAPANSGKPTRAADIMYNNN